jgi:hypothetical protein
VNLEESGSTVVGVTAVGVLSLVLYSSSSWEVMREVKQIVEVRVTRLSPLRHGKFRGPLATLGTLNEQLNEQVSP